ncbi:MAG TPA: hypothetical protein VG650_10095 [Mycobacteriales bacterium]|nr:hypothetical protein [Mycobacteriales bacterium]
MIVISGVLLLIAVVFLVIGLFGPLAWVYASIAVSVLSFVFLLVGVRQRRDIPAAAPLTPAAPRGGDAEPADVTLVPAAGRRTAEAAVGGAVAGAAAAVALEERAEPAPERVVERRPATATRRPTRPASTPASSRLRSATTERPRAVLPARLAGQDAPAKKATAAKKAAPAKAAAKKAAPAKAAAKKAAPAKKTTAAKKAAPAKAAAKKAAPAKKTAAKKTAR